MNERFEQIGKVIFGTQRLDGVLADVDRWLSGTEFDPASLADATPAADVCARRLAVAKAYFSANQTKAELARRYAQSVETVRDLLLQSGSLASMAPEGVEALLITTRGEHFAIADVAENLGYVDYPWDRLRERAATI